MKDYLIGLLFIVVGLVVGSVVNMALILSSGFLIPPPEGADVTTMEGLKASIHLFEPKHFLMPFLAHAFGTFVGSFTTSYLWKKKALLGALAIGILFFVGGVVNAISLPSPIWFLLVDLGFAYIPMAIFGKQVAQKISRK